MVRHELDNEYDPDAAFRGAHAQYEAEGFWGGDTIYSLARWHAEHTPDAFAVRDHFRRISYQALIESADALAADLDAHGLKPGQRVAVWLPSRIEAVVTLPRLLP